MKKLMSTIGIVALLVGTGFAQECDKGEANAKHRKHGKHGEMLANIPDLTEEQKAQMKQIKKDGREASKLQHQELRGLKEKLGALKMSENPDMESMNTMIDKMHQMEAELDKSRAASHIKAMSVLTPEQRKIFNENMQKKRAEREKMRKQRKEKREVKEAK